MKIIKISPQYTASQGGAKKLVKPYNKKIEKSITKKFKKNNRS